MVPGQGSCCQLAESLTHAPSIQHCERPSCRFVLATPVQATPHKPLQIWRL